MKFQPEYDETRLLNIGTGPFDQRGVMVRVTSTTDLKHSNEEYARVNIAFYAG
jgi:hypothetical protein